GGRGTRRAWPSPRRLRGRRLGGGGGRARRGRSGGRGGGDGALQRASREAEAHAAGREPARARRPSPAARRATPATRHRAVVVEPARSAFSLPPAGDYSRPVCVLRPDVLSTV